MCCHYFMTEVTQAENYLWLTDPTTSILQRKMALLSLTLLDGMHFVFE